MTDSLEAIKRIDQLVKENTELRLAVASLDAIKRIDQLVKENTELRLAVAERDGRIADLNAKLAVYQAART